MTKGYLDAYRVFKEPRFLQSAITNATFIKEKVLREDGGLNRTYKEGKSTINGYLEDYASTIDAFITIYETTSDEQWLDLSKQLSTYVFTHFYNQENGLFFFTSNEDQRLTYRSTEFYDNVIPASNSIMAKNIFRLSHYTLDSDYSSTAQIMLHNIQPNFAQSPTSFSNWMDLMLDYTQPYYEIVIVGENAQEKLDKLNTYYLPNALKLISTTESNLPPFKGRFSSEKTLIFVCVNNACKLPVTTVEEAINLMQ